MENRGVKKGKFSEIEFTSDYIITEQEKNIFDWRKKIKVFTS